MTNSVLSSLFSRPNTRFVNTKTNSQVMKGVKVVAAEIISASHNTDHPVSTEQLSESTTYTDLLSADIKTVKILRPACMRFKMIAPTASDLNAILTVFSSVEMTLTITSKSVMVPNMALTQLEIDQSPDMLSATMVEAEFEQVNPVSAIPSYDPQQPSNQSNIGISVQQPPTLAQSAQDLYNRVSSNISKFI